MSLHSIIESLPVPSEVVLYLVDGLNDLSNGELLVISGCVVIAAEFC